MIREEIEKEISRRFSIKMIEGQRMIGNRAIEREKKADFIIEHFPNVYKLDPLFSYKEVKEIREKMVEHGLYAPRQHMELIDASIINTIKYIQTGKRFIKNHSVQRKDKSKKHY